MCVSLSFNLTSLTFVASLFTVCRRRRRRRHRRRHRRCLLFTVYNKPRVEAMVPVVIVEAVKLRVIDVSVVFDVIFAVIFVLFVIDIVVSVFHSINE